MTTDKRMRRLEQQHHGYANLFRKVTSWELTHRALLQALLDQQCLDHRALLKDFDLQETVHPDLRDDAVIRQFVDEVQRRKAGPLPHAP